MRFGVGLVAGSILACVCAFARPETALASSCPQIGFYPPDASSGAYAFRFGDYEDVAGVADITLFTADASYDISLPVSIDAARNLSVYQSKFFSVPKPKSGAIVGGTMTFTNLLGERVCQRTFAVPQSARPSPSLAESLAPDTVVDLREGVPDQLPVCDEPFSDVSIDKPALPKMPEHARDVAGIVRVLVDVAPNASIYRMSIEKSSGHEELDAAGEEAAKSSTYKPAIFRCKPVEGTYIFTADFQHQ